MLFRSRLFARKRVREICEQTASMMGGRAELIVEPSYSPLINNDHMVDLVRNVACAQFGSYKVILRDVPSLGVEDFAYFAACLLYTSSSRTASYGKRCRFGAARSGGRNGDGSSGCLLYTSRCV